MVIFKLRVMWQCPAGKEYDEAHGDTYTLWFYEEKIKTAMLQRLESCRFTARLIPNKTVTRINKMSGSTISVFFQQKIVPETLEMQLTKAFNDTEISVQINREPKINKVSEYDRGTRQIEKDVILEFSSGQRIQCDLAYLSDVNSQWLTEAFFRFNFKVDVDIVHQNIDLIKKILYEVESVNLVEYEFDDQQVVSSQCVSIQRLMNETMFRVGR